MKKPAILLIAVTITAASCFMLYQKNRSKEPANEEQVEENEEDEKEAGEEKQLAMWFEAKAYPNPYNLNEKYQRAWEQVVRIKKERMSTYNRLESFSNWTSLGPCIDQNGSAIAGRILCIDVDKNNTNNLWAGSASGGIWKSTNAGASWTYVPTNLHVLGVSSILVDPSNSSIIYAGTGEVCRVDTSNIGFNVWKTRGTYGIGIIKSSDGGGSWSQVMTKNTAQLFAIQSMKFDPTNSNTIYACATDGLYRSTNNGTNWSQILAKIYVKDVAINPSNTNQIVVSIGNMVNADKGIYRTTNGNNASPTWTKITAGGIPAAFEGYISLDNVGAGVLMASIGMSSSGSPNEVYSSADFGANWSVLASTNHSSYQFWIAHTVAINPFFTDSIMFGGVATSRYKVSTGGKSTFATSGAGSIHADVHDIKFDPVNRGRIYICCDGGIYKSTNGGVSFAASNTGLNATQFYASLGVSANVTSPNRMIGGLQDNGQVLYNGTQWNQVSWGGGDGTTCAIDPGNHANILISRDAKQVFRSINGGTNGASVTSYWGFVADSRTAFVAPLAYSKSTSTTVYLASDNLHKSVDGGATWTNDAYTSATNYIDAKNKTGIAIAVSPTNANKVYVSTSPFAQSDNDVNNIIVTGQTNLLRTTTGNTPFTSIKGNLPDRFVMDIAISPTHDDSVFVVLGGFGTAHVYVTGNASAGPATIWTALGGMGSSGRIASVLPDVPFNAIVFDPLNSNIIYAGCDFGVYVSSDRGNSWIDYSSGFTDAVLVMDLQITSDNKIVAATHGKGVFKSDLFSGSTLPVRLIDFGGSNKGDKNELHWKVSQEQDLLQYGLERSTDGMHYQNVATVMSRNSLAETSYTYNDPVGLVNAEYYYRLKMTDIDGSFVYSPVVFIRTISKNNFTIQGNPFREYVTLKYTIATDQKIQLSYFNSSGSLIKKEDYQATSGTGYYTLFGLSGYPAGMYLLKLDSGNDHTSFKLIKN